MQSLIGILVDVSDSMKSSISNHQFNNDPQNISDDDITWAHSIFKVVNELIKHDVSSDNHVFAVGFGAKMYQNCDHPEVFDLLHSLEQVKHMSLKPLDTIFHDILTLLESSGAYSVRPWAKRDALMKVVSYDDALELLNCLDSSVTFADEYVSQCLPKVCIGKPVIRRDNRSVMFFIPNHKPSWTCQNIPNLVTEKEMENIVSKGKTLIKTSFKNTPIKPTLMPVNSASIINVHKASDILKNMNMNSRQQTTEMTKERIEEVLNKMKPYIYGKTPMFAALTAAISLFANPNYKDHKKILFILSDGMPTDDGPRTRLLKLLYGCGIDISKPLSDLDVNVVSCFVTNRHIDQPKRLYSNPSTLWQNGAQFMFNLSTTVATQNLPRTIFMKRDWVIDIENNATRLFFQINHPDIIPELCSLARDIVCCQDSLSDILTSIDLDLYINISNKCFTAKEQVDSTCYANASAAVLHLATKRIIGREGGYPDFYQLRNIIINKYSTQGANTLTVLQDFCPQYRLHCKSVNLIDAMKAITAKRPVLATFRLTIDDEWNTFSQFYLNNPTGTLTSDTLDISQRLSNIETSGHAVVFTSYNSESLTLMNSWGIKWAHNGFFRISNASVLNLEFIDVYWTLDDLSESEMKAHKNEGPNIARKLITSLKGLQVAQHQCSKCDETSRVIDFKGTMFEVECPACNQTFLVTPGSDLALNLYLLSLGF